MTESGEDWGAARNKTKKKSKMSRNPQSCGDRARHEAGGAKAKVDASPAQFRDLFMRKLVELSADRDKEQNVKKFQAPQPGRPSGEHGRKRKMTESGQACDDAACYQVGQSVHTFFSSVRGGGVERRVAKRADDDKGVQERKEVGAKRTKKKRKGKGHGVLDDKQEQGRTGATHQQPKPQGPNMVKKANKDPSPSCTTSGGPSSGAKTNGKRGQDVQHPFETDYNDHFETSFEAYSDIADVLELYASKIGKTRGTLGIYDPYYCAGGMLQHLARLGFTNVHNTNQDCYKVWEKQETPEYDVLVTNPPFSGEHKERCLAQCVASGKAWMVLLPSYCATKLYMKAALRANHANVFFAVPSHRYQFMHPEATGKETSPFFSLWFVALGPHTSAIYKEYLKKHASGSGRLRLAVSVRDLVSLKTAGVSTTKRLNPRQRAALKKKRF